LTNTTRAAAGQVVERLCQTIATQPIAVGETALQVTVSVGLAIREETGEPLDALIARADQALYKAKGAGRNRVEVDRQF
jgi:diguanylate cyclase (GGDEF)-like protein